MRNRGRGLSALIAACTLAACGGGGTGGDDAPPAELQLQALTVLTQPAGPESPFGTTDGGDTLRLEGVGFVAGLAVTVGAAPAAVQAVTSTEVTVTTPAGAEGFADVTVTNPDKASSSLANTFQYIAPPAVASALTQTGLEAGEARAPIAGGDTVEVTGSNFKDGVTADLGGVAVAVTRVDAQTLTFVAPAVAAEATVDVTVTNPEGLAATLPGGFFYTQEYSLDAGLDTLGDADARHLFRRAAFGGSEAEIAQATADGLAATVARLLDFTNDDAVELEATTVYGNNPPPLVLVNPRSNPDYWCHLLVANPNPLQERLAFFLHDHFATDQAGLPRLAHWFCWRQVNLFRGASVRTSDTMADGSAGLGYDWETILVEVAKDRAMLMWLNGAQSQVGRPNENFARELWELFMLGEGNGYTETDIQEAARAFTGFFVYATGGVRTDTPLEARYRATRHDTTEKTVLGATGRYGYDSVSPFFETSTGGTEPADGTTDPAIETDPADTDGGIVALTLQQRPVEASTFIVRKLFEYLVYDDPDQSLVDALAAELRANDWNLRPVLETLLLSKALFSARARKAQVSGPVEEIVGFLRTTGMELGAGVALNASRIRERMEAMGQVVLGPPDVNGWPRGLAWVSAQGILERFNTINFAVEQLDVPAQVDPLIPPAGQRSPAELVDHIATLLDVELDGATRDSYVAYVTSQLVGDQIVPFAFDPADEQHLEMKTRGLIWMIGQHHDAQRN